MTKEIPLTRGKTALIDDDDYENISKHKWYALKSGTRYYAARTTSPPNRKIVFMHREIMENPEGKEIDHINHNELDNTRKNLRACTHAQNMKNRKKDPDNTSGYKNVVWHRRVEKWQAHIVVDKKLLYLGCFDDIIQAAKVYDEAARKYHGEFAWTNFES